MERIGGGLIMGWGETAKKNPHGETEETTEGAAEREREREEEAASGPPADDQHGRRDGRLPPLMSPVAAERAAVRESPSRASASARNK